MTDTVDVVGYVAALVTNISFYPQAYQIFCLVRTQEWQQLDALSLKTFSLTGFGCILWLIYGIIKEIYPIIIGSTMTIIPSIYICTTLIFWSCYLKQKVSNFNISHETQVVDNTSIDQQSIL